MSLIKCNPHKNAANDDSEMKLWKKGGKRRGEKSQKSASFGEKCLRKFSQNGDQVAVGVKFYQQYGDENAQECEKIVEKRNIFEEP